MVLPMRIRHPQAFITARKPTVFLASRRRGLPLTDLLSFR